MVKRLRLHLNDKNDSGSDFGLTALDLKQKDLTHRHHFLLDKTHQSQS